MGLSIKQQKFADFYIETGNAYRSALKAGYSKNYSKGNIIKLLENVSVKSYIDTKMQEIEDKQIAKASEVLKHLTEAMRGEIDEEVVVVESAGDFMSEARIINKQISAKDRLKAAELLGKRYSLFTDNINLEGKVGVKIIDDISSDDDEGD